MVLGIIVTFYPNIEEVIRSLKNLKHEIDTVCIIENGSGVKIQNDLKIACNQNKTKIPNVHWVFNQENLGLAKAQNQGIKFGLVKNYDFFLLLDDDSLLSKGSVFKMRKYFITHLNVGIVAPRIIHENSNRSQKVPIIHSSGWIYRKDIQELENSIDVSTVIASGSLIRKKCLLDAGMMREDYFIDFVDIEFCLRIRSLGYKIVVLGGSKLNHKLGEEIKINLPVGVIYPTNHSPLRRYYMTRNRILTWKLYAKIFPLWFIYDFGNFIFDSLRFSLFDNDRWKKWKMFGKGFVDGLFTKI